MAKYSIEGSTLTGIADAIREKTGGSEEIKVEDMAEKIGEIIEPSGTKSITENGTHDVTSYASVEVNVPTSGGGAAVETCTVTVTQESSVLDDILAIRLLNGTIIAELCYAGNVSTITDVVVGTIISIVCVTNVYIYTSGGITYFYDDGFDGKVSFYTVTGDGTITIQKARNN